MTARPLRSVRVESAAWDAAAARTVLEGTTVSAVIRAALWRYAEQGEAPDLDAARVAAVRALHHGDPVNKTHTLCAHCAVPAPCPTLRILDA
jgi:anthranilate phosphoribosyltransferase